MSHEFKLAGFSTSAYPEDDELAMCTFLMKREDIGSTNQAFVMPKTSSIGHFNKVLVECCVNFLFECTQALSKNVDFNRVTPDEYAQAITTTESLKDLYSKRKTQHGLDIEMTHQIRGIAAMLQWMVNSTSWKDGEYHAFDAVEITQRLEALKVHSHI